MLDEDRPASSAESENHIKAISEEVSKKRGRPPSFEPWELHLAESCLSGAKSKRTLHNQVYRLRAISCLYIDHSDAARFRYWLPSQQEVREGKSLPGTALELIGRLPEDEMISLAGEICDLKIPHNKIVAFIKQYRRCDAKSPFNQNELVLRLSKVIDDYAITHEATYSQVSVALRSVSESVSELMEDET